MLDPRHSTESLLDVVFALMEEDPTMLDELKPSPKPWVLCIDDDYDFSRVLAHRLESLGIGVINAYEGKDGIDTAFTHPANAIILDYNMPNGQGDEVLRRLKEAPATAEIPVIVLTGNKAPELRQTMLNLGADVFAYKPLDFSSLIDELRGFIDIPGDDGNSGVALATSK